MLAARGVRRLVYAICAMAPAAATAAHADPCARSAPVSACFDADPLWVPTAPTPFTALPSARALAPRALSVTVAAGYSDRPVVLVTPSPHPDGQEIDVVRGTSTLTLGGRYGLAPGLDVGLALPFVPFQSGAGSESVTDQHGEPLTAVAMRDPRVELGATLLGRRPSAPFALGSRLTLGLPLGTQTAFAGMATFTVAPAATVELGLRRVAFGADLGWRITRAVNFGTVREGSAATVAVAAAVTLLEHPRLALGVDGWLAAHLAGEPPGVPSGTLDLPAEWLGSIRLSPEPAWTFVAAGGSGIPLSTVPASDGGTSRALGVTSPDFRLLLLARYTLDVR